ncbi:hypothetical protein [Devosia sp. A449]
MASSLGKAIRRWLRRMQDCGDSEAEQRHWQADPFAHPAIQRMTPAQLADLPIRRPACPGRAGDKRR